MQKKGETKKNTKNLINLQNFEYFIKKKGKKREREMVGGGGGK